jgi:predicted transcriptional regulator
MHRKRNVKMTFLGSTPMPSTADPLLSLVAQIVSAHVGHNDTPARGVPELIRGVYQALMTAGSGAAQPSTALAVRKRPPGPTVFSDHLVCMECGLHMKMLRRHLKTVHKETPAQYRAKWGLPGDYPMVARQYAALRSSLAKKSGLGKRAVPRSR